MVDEIHFWCPDLFATKGGIQTYSLFLLRSLRSILPDHHLRVTSKNDKTMPAQLLHGLEIKPSCFGDWPLALRSCIFAAGAGAQVCWRQPKLIVTTHINFSIVSRYLNKVTDVPYWIIAHGIEVWGLADPRLKAALCNAELVLAVSRYTRDRLLAEQNLDERKVALLPNTFDSTRFRITRKPDYLLHRYGLREEQLVILSVSRLDEREKYKGYDKILQALPEVRRQIPDVCYLIAGRGNDQQRIEKIVNENGLSGSVKMIGYIPDEELSDHYNLCDVFAMPSKGEGFGIVFLEALACGKSVLAGNKDGSVDALLNGELGVLVDPDNIEEIADGLNRILLRKHAHPLIYNRHGLRRRVIETYGIEQFRRKLGGIFADHTSWSVSNRTQGPEIVTSCAE